MKFIAVIGIIICLAAAFVHSDDVKVGSAYDGGASSGSSYGGSGGAASYGGGHSGSGASIAAPPCPKNYLFSCQPSIKPAPCSSQATSGFGGAGAYSEHYPVYALQVPQYVNAFQTY